MGLALLERSFGTGSFQKNKVDEIVTAVLEAHGIPSSKQKWQFTASYPKREHCVRYMESAQ